MGFAGCGRRRPLSDRRADPQESLLSESRVSQRRPRESNARPLGIMRDAAKDNSQSGRTEQKDASN